MQTGIRALHHVGIAVPDLDAAKAFYGGLLGMTVLHSRPWSEGDARMDAILGLQGSSGERALLEGFGARIELWCFRTPAVAPDVSGAPERSVAVPGITHLCFQVDDLLGVHAALVTAGIRFLSEPSRGPTGSLAVYGRDPFGNHFELFQPPPEAG